MDEMPAKIGRFEVTRFIGRGAIGAVYEARDPAMDRTVVVKKFARSDLLGGDRGKEFRARFLQEARAAGKLRHPNIVVIYDVDMADDLPFMAMEFAEGGSLTDWMKAHGAMPLPRAAELIQQVALGLAHAHERGIVHRDIKPDNILLTGDGRPIITDFGSAHLQDSELTRTGEQLGTPHYMSPEQITGGPIDGRSDLFALGVVFYLLVTGRRPFKGDTVSSVCYNIVHSPPEPIPADFPEASVVAPVLNRLMAKSPRDRFATGRHLAAALAPFVAPGTDGAADPSVSQTLDLNAAPRGAAPAPTAPPGPAHVPRPETPTGQPSPAPRRQGRSWPAMAAAGFIVLGLCAVIALALNQSFRQRLKSAWTSLRATPAVPAGTEQEAGKSGAPPARPAGAEAGTVAGLHPAAVQPPAKPAPKEPGRGQGMTGTRRVEPEAPAVVASRPSVAFLSSAVALEGEAKSASDLAAASQFDKAFPALDQAASRLVSLRASASPADAPALRQAEEAVARSSASCRDALTAWAKPILDRGAAALAEATAHVNTDEDAIIKAYAETYPVLRWKERLPQELAQAADAFAAGCREELNDDEWAQAEAMAQGRPLP